eukprot:Nitzschia sp. Nitz4//scaffold28_size193895//100895//102136//NITZ4_001661-RA/size193895-processed-gene-0.227-mRNA-1//1//CDS//3329545970//6514//frame0
MERSSNNWSSASEPVETTHRNAIPILETDSGAMMGEMSGSPEGPDVNLDDDAVITAPVATLTRGAEREAPAEIPPDKSMGAEGSGHNSSPEDAADNENADDSDWGEEDSYEYEDEDDVAFSGFLAPSEAPVVAAATKEAPRANIVEEDLLPSQSNEEELASPPEEPAVDAAKQKWKDPTPEAVSMSLRAQSESTGGKRRLAQDLYRILNQDTAHAGFSMEPKNEDSMDTWTIKLFQFDDASNLAKDMAVLNVGHVELEMKFPEQYPFEPPYARVVRPRFKRQTGFVMNGALCMELLTKEGWNPINDIESVIVSIRSLLVVGDGRLQAATQLTEERYEAALQAAKCRKREGEEISPASKRTCHSKKHDDDKPDWDRKGPLSGYSAKEAEMAFNHLSTYHKKKGWDNTGWWARKG